MRRWSATTTLVACLLLAISGVAASNETTPTITTVVTPTTVTPPPTTTAAPTTTPPPTTTPAPTTTASPTTTAPPTQPPLTTAPPTQAPPTAAPVTNAPKTAAPATQAPTASPSTDAPTPSTSAAAPTPTTTTALRTATKSPVVTPAPSEAESTALGVWPVVGIIAAGAIVLAGGVVCFIKRRHMRSSTTVRDDPLTPTHAAGAAVFDTYTDGTTPTAADVDTAPRFHNENDSYMEEARRPQLWESTLESQADTSFVSDSHGTAFDSFVSRSSTGNDTFVR
ncbi:hypothetical protein SDRG_10490 [Saprolegnia diclina VS20]|uniref:Uncharacterized protein n=1 Tax=Saprolegnia diclina (strain VS20) TaxID=1156394 RepID=T0QBF3_SAPDV|nr:hypothetical protein SDRG_10490 [Saprolegnia diclina VS20]EQC31976.1 hypothetical protein SDRG_10490 [Saprolegnia diclina VS20]|eukprot:XP_008614704.1 hypothetical protein SDRG_10490 [Saprolegnia diclina VS20]